MRTIKEKNEYLTNKAIHLNAGHTIKNGRGTGAITKYGDEAIEADIFVNDLYELLKADNLPVIRDDSEWNFTQEVADVKKFKGIMNAFHFNSFSNPQANGAEVIIPTNYNQNEIKLAEQVARLLGKFFNLRGGFKTATKGVKLESETPHKKLGILRATTQDTSILTEFCFISNENDMKIYKKNYKEILTEYYLIIKNFRIT